MDSEKPSKPSPKPPFSLSPPQNTAKRRGREAEKFTGRLNRLGRPGVYKESLLEQRSHSHSHTTLCVFSSLKTHLTILGSLLWLTSGNSLSVYF